MNARHTPGPWRIGDAGRSVFGPKDGNPAPVTVAALPPVSPRVGAETRRANARLIAAAPELLAALEDLLKICISRGESLGLDNGGPVLDFARATIAKARGEVSA